MSFEENLKSFASRIDNLKGNIATEEATKTSLIMPFFQMLGYDVFNPMEFIPEFTADVGIKKGEKVDYAISLNGKITILIEAKCINEQLDKHDSQLFRYFGTTEAKFGILTNGIIYKFYSDLEEPNKMDTSPFFQIDLTDLADNEITELKKFSKENFDLNRILDTASELKYLGLIKKALKEEFTAPSDEFVRFILSNNVYDGVKTQNVIDKYKPLVKKSITQYINDLVNEKIQLALNNHDSESLEKEVVPELEDDLPPADAIVTTEEETQAYYIVKSIIGVAVPLERISYKDTLNYFAVLLDGKVTKWICRIYLKERTRFVIIPEDNQNIKYAIETIEDIYKLKDAIVKRAIELINK